MWSFQQTYRELFDRFITAHYHSFLAFTQAVYMPVAQVILLLGTKAYTDEMGSTNLVFATSPREIQDSAHDPCGVGG